MYRKPFFDAAFLFLRLLSKTFCNTTTLSSSDGHILRRGTGLVKTGAAPPVQGHGASQEGAWKAVRRPPRLGQFRGRQEVHVHPDGIAVQQLAHFVPA